MKVRQASGQGLPRRVSNSGSEGLQHTLCQVHRTFELDRFSAVKLQPCVDKWHGTWPKHSGTSVPRVSQITVDGARFSNKSLTMIPERKHSCFQKKHIFSEFLFLGSAKIRPWKPAIRTPGCTATVAKGEQPLGSAVRGGDVTLLA